MRGCSRLWALFGRQIGIELLFWPQWRTDDLRGRRIARYSADVDLLFVANILLRSRNDKSLRSTLRFQTTQASVIQALSSNHSSQISVLLTQDFFILSITSLMIVKTFSLMSPAIITYNKSSPTLNVPFKASISTDTIPG